MADDVRKTSLGMQAIGAARLELPRGELRKDDRRAQAGGASLTPAPHLATVATIIIMNAVDRGHVEKAQETPPNAIEAGLAIKKKTQEGKKSALPQKEVAAKVKPPDVPGVAHNAEQIPQPKPE